MGLFAALVFAQVVTAIPAFADRVIVTPSGGTLAPSAASTEGIYGVDRKVRRNFWINASSNSVEFEAVNLQAPVKQATVLSVQGSLLPETLFTPSISVGVRDILNCGRSFGSEGYDGRSIYLAGGKTAASTAEAPYPFRNAAFTLGVGTGVTRGVFGSVSAQLSSGLRQTFEFDGTSLNYRIDHDFGSVARVEYERIHGENFVGLELHSAVHF